MHKTAKCAKFVLDVTIATHIWYQLDTQSRGGQARALQNRGVPRGQASGFW